tara:strand:+ start:1349 stop:2020 length:672 start_codon:yes stop_codon:yes gene_type:complete
MLKSIVISVIVPARNSELYIGRCLRSLLNQSFDRDKFEIILINDASTDNTRKALSTFMGDIVYIENKKRRGLPGSLNLGIKRSRGMYIVRVDSDDWVHSDYLNILFQHLYLNNKLDAVACDYLELDNNEKVLSQQDCEKKPIGCGIMFKSIQLVDIGLYDKKFLAREDEDLLHRFKKKYTVTRVPIPLYRYRKHGNNMTKKKKVMKKFLKKINLKHKKNKTNF